MRRCMQLEFMFMEISTYFKCVYLASVTLQITLGRGITSKYHHEDQFRVFILVRSRRIRVAIVVVATGA